MIGRLSRAEVRISSVPDNNKAEVANIALLNDFGQHIGSLTLTLFDSTPNERLNVVREISRRINGHTGPI